LSLNSVLRREAKLLLNCGSGCLVCGVHTLTGRGEELEQPRRSTRASHARQGRRTSKQGRHSSGLTSRPLSTEVYLGVITKSILYVLRLYRTPTILHHDQGTRYLHVLALAACTRSGDEPTLDARCRHAARARVCCVTIATLPTVSR
jgi:hypothetical protein